MAYIKINEIDQTKIYSNTAITVETVVLVPGVATRGAFYSLATANSDNQEDEPIYGKITRSVQEFIDEWGDKPPAVAPMSWLYAYGIVKAGLPVYFIRICNEIPDCATFISTVKADTNEFLGITLTAKQPGTEGNRFSAQLRLTYSKQSASSQFNVVLSTYKADSVGSANKGTRIESLSLSFPKSSLDPKYYDAETGDPSKTFPALLANQLASLDPTYFDIDDVDLDVNSIFNKANLTTDSKTTDEIIADRLAAISEYFVNNASFTLSGGTDGFDDDAQGIGGLGSPTTESSIKGILSSREFYAKFSDKYKYDYSIVTAGGYSDTAIDARMIALCETRGDCHCLVDVPYGTSSVGTEAYLANDIYDTSYAASFTPWCEVYSPLDSTTKMWMPASYVHLKALGSSLQNYPVWFAQAGVKRGSLYNIIQPEYEIGESLMDRWTNKSIGINPIMKLRNYGYVIYGQRTLKISPQNNVRTAFESLNVRMLSSIIKKYIFEICLALSFDQNTRRLWNEFKAKLDPVLLYMKRNEGIDDYLIIMDETTVTPRAQAELRVPGYVVVSPIRAAERFEIGFILTQVGVEFTNDKGEVTFNYQNAASSNIYEIQTLGIEDNNN